MEEAEPSSIPAYLEALDSYVPWVLLVVLLLAYRKQVNAAVKAVGEADGRRFTKSTKALEVAGGCLIQVSTEVGGPDGALSAAEALSFVPGVRIQPEADGIGGTLVATGG